MRRETYTWQRRGGDGRMKTTVQETNEDVGINSPCPPQVRREGFSSTILDSSGMTNDERGI